MEYYDGSNWYPLAGPDGTNFSLGSGDVKSFEKEALGDDFKPQKLTLIIEKATKLSEFGPDRWVIALTEFSAYSGIVLTGEAKLIPATKLTAGCSPGDTVLNVGNTAWFPSSGIAYAESDQFSYTGKTATTLTGVTGISSIHASDSRVSLRLETSDSPDIYDPNDLLPQFGDRLYKVSEISKYLNTQDKIEEMAQLYLRELCMAITTVQAPAYRPDAVVGDTVLVHDPINAEADQLYFVEEVACNDGNMTFKLSKYWAIDQEDS
jgi:hypothetical protein